MRSITIDITGILWAISVLTHQYLSIVNVVASLVGVRFAGHDRDKVAYFRLVMNIKDIKYIYVYVYQYIISPQRFLPVRNRSQYVVMASWGKSKGKCKGYKFSLRHSQRQRFIHRLWHSLEFPCNTCKKSVDHEMNSHKYNANSWVGLAKGIAQHVHTHRDVCLTFLPFSSIAVANMRFFFLFFFEVLRLALERSTTASASSHCHSPFPIPFFFFLISRRACKCLRERDWTLHLSGKAKESSCLGLKWPEMSLRLLCKYSHGCKIITLWFLLIWNRYIDDR